MDKKHIIAFATSIQNVFRTMLKMEVCIGTPVSMTPGSSRFDVSAIIGMSGDCEGTVVISFPQAAAERIANLFAGMDVSQSPEDLADAIGELINMISGSAKGLFAGKQAVNITCPTVVMGSRHTVFNGKDVVCIGIPCNCDCGEFLLEVSMVQNANIGETAANNAA